MDLFSIIESKMPEFSKGQKLIANYILKDYDKAAYMTASRLGATVGISESTVVRFAMELGFDGYPELQFALQSIIKNRLRHLGQTLICTGIMVPIRAVRLPKSHFCTRRGSGCAMSRIA